jgi:hypothetical protein
MREDPDWWVSIVTTYNAYEKGFLPNVGGIDDQPSLLVPIMAIMTSAIHDEEELDRLTKDRTPVNVPSSGNKQGRTSLLNGPAPQGRTPIGVPPRKG